jgi:predicted transport protein
VSDLTIEDFFQGRGDSRRLFDTIFREVNRLGDVTVRVSKSQVAFRRKKNFAVVWMPVQYLANRPTAPLVLTLSFPQRDRSPRWKEITEVGPKRFTHHLELYQEGEIDNQVRHWLQTAWEEAA